MTAVERTAGRWRCPECGRTNSPRDRYCGGCGHDDEAQLDPEELEAEHEAANWTPIPGIHLPSSWTAPSAAGSPRMGESGAHKLLNALLQLWALGLALVILLPLLAGSGAGAGGTAVGAVAGFGLAAVLFVPWLIGLVILLVLRSTTRGR